jgi:chromosome partitioning protein
MGKEMHRKGQLDRIATGFDVVAIDCPGRDGAVVRSALMVADIAVVPCGASPADAWALAQTLDMIEEARTLRPSLQVCVVITRKRETGIGKGAHSDLSAAGVPVSSVVLGERVAYQQAMGEGRGVTSYGLATPAAKEIRALATYIEKLVEKANESTVARVA